MIPPAVGAAPDLRLAPAAIGGFASALAVAAVSAEEAFALGVCGGVAAVACVVIARVYARRSGHVSQLRVLGVCAATAAVVCAVGGVEARLASSGPLASAEPVRATVRFEVRTLPRPGPDAVAVDVLVREVSRGSARWETRTRATVFARGERWLALEPGTVARGVATTRPGGAGGAEPAGGTRDLVLSMGGDPTVERRPAGLFSVAARVRDALRVAASPLPDPADDLLGSMVLGDRRGVDPDLDLAFRDAGLSHLAAVSGANIAYVLGGAVWLAAACGTGRRTRLGAGLGAVAVFCVVVGPEPSVLRALAMATISVYALASGRARDAVRLLLAVVLAFSLASPSTVRGLGFVLSVAATAGIVLAATPVESLLVRAAVLCGRSAGALWRGTPWRAAGTGSVEPARPPVGDTARALRRRHPLRLTSAALALALVAHVATAPVLLATGRSVSPWAVARNVAVAPVVPYVAVVGTSAAALAPFAPPVARGLAWTCAPALLWVAWIATLGTTPPTEARNVGERR